MKYRAVLNDQNDPELQIRAQQRIGDIKQPLVDWARAVLQNRKRPASVEIFRTTELIDEVIYPQE